MLSIEETQQLLPQKKPFVLIDTLVWTDGKRTRSSFRVPADHVLLEDGKLTEAGITENIAQTAAAGAGYTCMQESRPVPVGYIGLVRGLEIFSRPVVSDALVTEVTVDEAIGGITSISGKIHCGEQLVAQCEMRIFS